MRREYYSPTRVIIDRGVSGEVKELLSLLEQTYSSIYVAVSKTLWEKGVLGVFRNALDGLGVSVHFNVYSVKGPRLEDVAEIIRDVEACEADLAIAVGGGSLVDAVKLGLALYASGYVSGKELRGREVEIIDTIPLIVIPTTHIGAETSMYSYMVLPETKAKAPFSSTKLYPRIAAVDPVFSMNMERRVEALSAMALLGQAIEAYVSLSATWFSRLFAREAARLVIRSYYSLLSREKYAETKEDIHAASALTGLAISHSSPTLLTAMAQALSGLYGIGYAEAYAPLLPVWLQSVRSAREKALGELAWFSQVGVTATTLINWVDTALYAAQLPRRLRELGVDMESIRTLALIVWNHMRRFAENNPVPASTEYIIELYKQAY